LVKKKRKINENEKVRERGEKWKRITEGGWGINFGNEEERRKEIEGKEEEKREERSRGT
jgi:hypothetical protein